MSSQIKLTIPGHLSGIRLDKALAELLPDFSRSFLKELIEKGKISISEGKPKASVKVKEGMEIELDVPEPKEMDLIPVPMVLNILYEDRDLLVLNKPPGLVVHPAPGNFDATLVHALIAHCKDLSDINGILRPGIVHRLDKDTSGCLVIAKNNLSHQKLAAQFENREIKKIYQCLVSGKWTKGKQKITDSIGRHPVARKKMTVRKIGGKEAVSIITPLEVFENASLLEVELHTGRTHQIRVHLSHAGHPILGDTLYGKGGYSRQMLHAWQLGFKHPGTDKFMEFQAECPPDMKQIINQLRQENSS